MRTFKINLLDGILIIALLALVGVIVFEYHRDGFVDNLGPALVAGVAGVLGYLQYRKGYSKKP